MRSPRAPRPRFPRPRSAPPPPPEVCRSQVHTTKPAPKSPPSPAHCRSTHRAPRLRRPAACPCTASHRQHPAPVPHPAPHRVRSHPRASPCRRMSIHGYRLTRPCLRPSAITAAAPRRTRLCRRTSRAMPYPPRTFTKRPSWKRSSTPPPPPPQRRRHHHPPHPPARRRALRLRPRGARVRLRRTQDDIPAAAATLDIEPVPAPSAPRLRHHPQLDELAFTCPVAAAPERGLVAAATSNSPNWR
jgi:hypothetical protein